MDSEDSPLDNECENLMNLVVESRKRFGKMCVDYERKTSFMENKILNLRIDTFSHYKFKPKNPVPTPGNEDDKDIEQFPLKMIEKTKRCENLQKKVKDTLEVVMQLKGDGLGNRLREPLSAEVILARVKKNEVS